MGVKATRCTLGEQTVFSSEDRFGSTIDTSIYEEIGSAALFPFYWHGSSEQTSHYCGGELSNSSEVNGGEETATALYILISATKCL